jgi:hypothetical protein
MTHEVSPSLSQARFGFWIALSTGFLTLITFIVAIMTPPLSGPFCREGCYQYPYLDIASRFPRDYYWMFPAMVATLLFVALIIALHERCAPGKRGLSFLAVVLSAMGALVLVGDYFIQVAVIQPSVLAREADGVSILSQYNPHGLFIALEELGYILMSLSLAVAALPMTVSTRLEKAVRWLFLVQALVGMGLLFLIVGMKGHAREYLFEIAIISVVWLALIAGAFMLSVVFRRDVGRLKRDAIARS